MPDIFVSAALTSDSALSKMLIFDFFQVGGTQAEMNKLDPSTFILAPDERDIRCSCLPFDSVQRFFFSQKHIFKVQEARCGIQIMSKASIEMRER